MVFHPKWICEILTIQVIQKPNLVKGKGSKVRRFLAFDRTCMVNHLAFTARTHVALQSHFFAGYHISAIFSCYYHWQCICDICTAAIPHKHLLFNTPLLPQCHTRVWEVSDGMSNHLLAMVLEWWKQSGSICLALKFWLLLPLTDENNSSGLGLQFWEFLS